MRSELSMWLQVHYRLRFLAADRREETLFPKGFPVPTTETCRRRDQGQELEVWLHRRCLGLAAGYLTSLPFPSMQWACYRAHLMKGVRRVKCSHLCKALSTVPGQGWMLSKHQTLSLFSVCVCICFVIHVSHLISTMD